MEIKTASFFPGRRQFLTKILPSGALLCLGCKGLLAVPIINAAKTASGQKPKYLDDSGMSVEDVYKFGIGYFVPTYQALAEKIGKEKFLAMLTEASTKVYSQMFVSMAKDCPDRNLKCLESIFQTMLSEPLFSKAFHYEITENTDEVLELRFTECLPAKIFREMNAAEIGYALECAPTNGIAKSFNPKMKAENPKNLIKGDSVCIERFVLET